VWPHKKKKGGWYDYHNCAAPARLKRVFHKIESLRSTLDQVYIHEVFIGSQGSMVMELAVLLNQASHLAALRGK
jgi:hypothetical protein